MGARARLPHLHPGATGHDHRRAAAVGRGLHELRKFQDTVKGELDGVLHYDEDQPSAAVNGAESNGLSGSVPINAADAPPALPPVEADAAPPAPKAASRAPSRFRAPGSQPTT